jgi:hypothetical protein
MNIEHLYDLNGHMDKICALVISRDNKYCISAGDFTIIVWDLASRNTIAILRGCAGKTLALGLTSNITTLISSSEENSILLWNLSEKKVKHILSTSEPIVSLSITSDDKYLIGTGLLYITTIWNLRQKSVVYSISFPEISHMRSILSDDSIYLISKYSSNTILIFSIPTLRPTSLVSLPISIRSFCMKASNLFLCAHDSILIYSLSKNRILRKCKQYDGILYKPIALSDRFILGADLNNCWGLWDSKLNKNIIKDIQIYSSTTSKDGKLLAIGSHMQIKIYSLRV